MLGFIICNDYHLSQVAFMAAHFFMVKIIRLLMQVINLHRNIKNLRGIWISILFDPPQNPFKAVKLETFLIHSRKVIVKKYFKLPLVWDGSKITDGMKKQPNLTPRLTYSHRTESYRCISYRCR